MYPLGHEPETEFPVDGLGTTRAMLSVVGGTCP